MMRVSDTILGKTRGTLNQALAIATIPLTRVYMTEVYRLAPLVGIDASIVIAQWHLETDGGKSARWLANGNPAGLGIASDEDPDPATFSGVDAARVHLWALLVAVQRKARPDPFPELPTSSGPFLYRWFKKYNDPNCPTVVTIDDLNIRYVDKTGEPQATWAWDSSYQDGIVQRGALIFGNVPDQGAPAVAPFSTQVPGLPGGPLQTTYPIRFNLIPLGNTFQRPGIKARTPRCDVTHGTGNPSNSSAMAEAQYFVNGAEGRQASVHACIDDNEVVIVVPLDEVTWQAADGGGPGNMNGNSSEMMEADAIWNNVARRNKLIAITADFKGRTAARLGIGVPKKHWDYNAGSSDRHHCPDKLMSTGLWDSQYVPLWQAARDDELKRMNGETPTDPDYAKPDTSWMEGEDTTLTMKVNGKDRKIPVWSLKREYEATKETWRYQGPDTTGPKVGDKLKVGETFTGAYVAQVSAASYRAVTPAGSWILMTWLTPKVTVRAK